MSDPVFLFSVDVEEFDVDPPGRSFRRSSLPKLLESYVRWLGDQRATFFIVGEVARLFPDAIRSLHLAGHELACHTNSHQRLDEFTPDKFRIDLELNRDAILSAAPGADVRGFRAPVLSMTPSTAWAYEILAGLGFTYSSSVLAARNPLYGWPGFGSLPRHFGPVVELPLTMGKFGPLNVPFAAGTYFRTAPTLWLKRQFLSCAKAGFPVLGYFHPYDIDHEQEYVMNRGVRRNLLLNHLLYINRKKTLPRLNLTRQWGFRILSYSGYLKDVT